MTETTTESMADARPPETPLKGMTVLVTGAAAGAAANVARVLGVLGANLHLADSNEAALIEATRTYRDDTQGGIKLHPAQLDRMVSLEALAMECDDMDVLVHMAGTFPEDGEEDETRRAWTRRVLGAYPLITETVIGFQDRGRGLILFPLPDLTDLPHPAMAGAALKTLIEDEAIQGELPQAVKLEWIEATPDHPLAETIAARVVTWWNGEEEKNASA